MDMELFGIKELYDVTLSPTYDIEIGERKVTKGEPLLFFGSLDIMQIIGEFKKKVASGGFDNRPHIVWESLKSGQIFFSKGVFSRELLAFFLNSRLVSKDGNKQLILIDQHQIVESDKNGVITLRHSPLQPIYIYDYETGERLVPIQIEDKHITIGKRFTSVAIFYKFEYTQKVDTITIGNQLLSGFLSLTAKVKNKIEETGEIKTGILRIPKVRLMSNLSLKLGNDVSPQVGNIGLEIIPVGSKGSTVAIEYDILTDNIDSDI